MKDGVLSFHVPGIPSTQGSKKSFIIRTKAGPKAGMKDTGGEDLASWRETVRREARAAAGPSWQRLDEAVAVDLAFGLKAPKNLPKRRRVWPIGSQSGDVDKLTRAVFDSITQALVWRDDALVVDLHVTKEYAEPGGEGVTVSIRRKDGTPPGGITLTGTPLMEGIPRS